MLAPTIERTPGHDVAERGVTFYLGPKETDSLARWDILSEEFIRTYPVLVVRIEVFSVPDEVLGASRASEMRGTWLDFMNECKGARNRNVIFCTAENDDNDGLTRGDWFIKKIKNNAPNKSRTRQFRRILDRMSKSGRQSLVVLQSSDDIAALTNKIEVLKSGSWGNE